MSEVEGQVSSVLQQAQAVGTVLHSALQVREQKNQEIIMWNDTFLQFFCIESCISQEDTRMEKGLMYK